MLEPHSLINYDDALALSTMPGFHNGRACNTLKNNCKVYKYKIYRETNY